MADPAYRDRLLAATVESSRDAIISTDLDGLLMAWNPAAERLLGYRAADVLGRPTDEFLLLDDGARTSELRRRIAGGDTVGPVAAWRRHRDGHAVEILLTAFPVVVDGEVVGLSAIYADAAGDRRDAERRALLAAVVDTSPDAILTVRDGLISSWNRGAETLFGYTADEAIGQPYGLTIPAGRAEEADELRIGPVDGPILPIETIRLRKDGSVVEVGVTVSPIESVAHETGSAVFSVVARDITEQREYQAQLRHQAFHDPLTGASNRTVLIDRLELAIRRALRHDETVLVAFLDLDGFKAVNDTHGHGAGDKLLTLVARRLEETVRAEDTVARFGGDEFVIVCEAVSRRDIMAIPPRLQANLRRPFVVDGAEHVLSASIGLSLGDGTSSPERLLRDADRAMYRAKAGGRGRIASLSTIVHPA